MTDDLVAWLTQIWDEQEKEASSVGAPDGFYPEPYDPGSAMHHEAVLARIAADRQILARHSGERDEMCQSWDGNYVYEPCETLRLLAQPYASRPGFRDEWRVTAVCPDCGLTDDHKGGCPQTGEAPQPGAPG